jgi:hypothetical protein
MSNEPQVFLDVSFDFHGSTPDPLVPWWKDPTILGAILRGARELDLWLGFRHYGHMGSSRLAPIRSVDDLIAETPTWDDRGWVLQSRHQDDPRASSLTLSLRQALFRLQLTVGSKDLAARRDTLLPRAIELVALAHRALAGRAWLGAGSSVRVLGLDHAHVRPPREHPVIALGTLATLVDADYVADRDRRIPDENLLRDFATLRAAELPADTAREEREGLLAIRWTLEPLDAPTMSRACARSEEWLGRALVLPPLWGWNELGDQEIDVSELEPHPPLTLYDDGSERGYKTVAATKTGQVRPARALDQIAGWIRDGTLPDGSPVSEVVAIAPSRDAALAIRDRALKLGVSRVVYTDNDARLWDPFPPGDWIA